MIYFDIRSNRDGYNVEAEQRVTFHRDGRTHHLVMDVVIYERGVGTSVIDWKTHNIFETDLRQVEYYQRHLVQVRNIPPTRIFGFAADLLHESVEERHYRKLDTTYAASRISGHRSVLRMASPNPTPQDRYPARVSVEACGICPFLSVCSDSPYSPIYSGKDA
jgi:hypothetical protein